LKAALLACALAAFLAAPAAAAPNWLDSADLSKPGRDASNPAIAMDAAGNTVALWERQSTLDPSFNLQISTRPAGGVFSAPADFILKGTEPQLAMTPAGEAVAVWKHFENPPGNYVIQMSTRPPGGGSFSAPVTVFSAPPSVIPQELSLAVGAGGDVAVTWSNIDPDADFDKVVCGKDPKTMADIPCGNPPFVQAAVRPAGGVFTAAQRISVPRGTEAEGETEVEKKAREAAESKRAAFGAQPAVDAAGNTVVAWSFFDGTDSLIHSAVRPAGGVFSEPGAISAVDSASVELDMDSAGNAIATWVHDVGPARLVQAALRPPGGSFALLGNVSPAGATAEGATIDVTEGGAATIAWRLVGFTETYVQAASRPPGGAFSPPVNVSSGKDGPLFPELATNEAGDTVVVWSGDNGANEITRAAVRPPGGAFAAPVAISQISGDLFHPEPSIDASGNATVVWVRDNGTHSIIQWAGYDADPPELRDVSIPGAATVGETVQFSASAADVWPVGKPSFDFGDGGKADGTSVSHSYSAPGSYTVTATATDAVGRKTTQTGTLVVKARNFFTIGKLKKNRNKGTATLTVTIPEPGTLVASGRGIKKATVKAAKAGAVKIRLKAAGKGLKRLNKKGKLKAKLKLAYSPDGGDTNIKSIQIVLSKKTQ
jgi:hypothetical protein